MSDAIVPIHRLRLTRSELERLAQIIEQEEGTYSELRIAERLNASRPAVLIQGRPGEIVSRHEVYLRNISRSGAAILHTAFLPSQQDCYLVVIGTDRTPLTLEATVVRCQHTAGHIHDVGLRFAEQLTGGQTTLLSAIDASDPETERAVMPFREALARCRGLADEVCALVESGASAEQVLPLLNELRRIEPPDRPAA